MRKITWLGAAALAVILCVLFVFPGTLRSIQSHFDGTCRTVPIEAGVGDISMDNARGVAYLAYLDQMPNSGKLPRGTVMLIDLNASEPRIRAALLSDPPDFRPVALSLYTPTQAAKRLFVVDAGVELTAIHIFEQSSTGAFALVKTIHDNRLLNPSSIAAVGPEQFYVTVHPSWQGPTVTSLTLMPPESSLMYYDGARFTNGVSGLTTAMGLTTNATGNPLYVTELARKRLQVFTRDPRTGGLTPKQTYELGSLPYHVTADAEGNLWIATYPRAIAAVRSLNGAPTPQAPTQILELSANDGKLSEIYANDGSELKGGSVAAVYAGRVLIASLSDRKLLLCRWAAP